MHNSTELTERKEMTFIDHLKELRQRLVYSLIALGLCFAVLFFFANDLYSFISEPLRLLLPPGATMIATDVTSPFFAPFRLALFFSLVLSMPVILTQLWLFIAPGLYNNEKQFAIPMFSFSIFLFYAGMAFAYFIVFPLIFSFFLGVAPQGVMPMTDISSFLSFVLKVLIAFGLAFQVPIATLLLLQTGLVEKATLIRQRPFIFVGCFVFGMLITPPDVFSQVFIALPMWILFELGLFLHRYMPKKETDDSDPDLDSDSKDTPHTEQTIAPNPNLSRPDFSRTTSSASTSTTPKKTVQNRKTTTASTRKAQVPKTAKVAKPAKNKASQTTKAAQKVQTTKTAKPTTKKNQRSTTKRPE